MKIGVFSDVHGHLDELNKTLSLLESLEVDEIICAGDLIDKGIQSDEVVALMQERAIPCVQGNHDAKALYNWLPYAEPLRDQSLTYLNNLPLELTFDWLGVSVYLCHANPWQDTSVYVFSTRPDALFKLVAEAVTAKVIILGHTHQPMRIDIDDKVILNPGSIYGNCDRNERTCAVLTLPHIQFNLYDIDTGRQIAI